MNVINDGHSDERVREVERACFSPLVFAGPTATTLFKKLVSMLADKRGNNYSKCLFWLRCRLCFSLLRSSVMCLRGHRSSNRGPLTSKLIWPAPRVAWSLVACRYFQLSSTLIPSAGGSGKGSPSSPGKKRRRSYCSTTDLSCAAEEEMFCSSPKSCTNRVATRN